MPTSLRALAAAALALMTLVTLLPRDASAQPGPKGSVYKTWTLKNTSSEDANDLHIVVTNAAGTVVEAVSKARSAAFTDPPGGEGTSTLDWPNAGNPGGSVPAGLSDQIALCNEDTDFLLDFGNTFFTKDAAPLSTGYVTHTWKWDLDADASTVSLEIGNPAHFAQGTIRVLSIQAYVDNAVENFRIDEATFPYETPTGSLALDTNNVDIAEGATVVFDLGSVQLDGYELAISTVAPLSNLSNTFAIASGFRPRVPALPSLGAPAMSLLLVLILVIGVLASRWIRATHSPPEPTA